MAASELAYGEGHPATYTEQPVSRTRRMELSGEAFGEDQPGMLVRAAPSWPAKSSDDIRDT